MIYHRKQICFYDIFKNMFVIFIFCNITLKPTRSANCPIFLMIIDRQSQLSLKYYHCPWPKASFSLHGCSRSLFLQPLIFFLIPSPPFLISTPPCFSRASFLSPSTPTPAMSISSSPTGCVSPGLPDWSWGFLLLLHSSVCLSTLAALPCAVPWLRVRNVSCMKLSLQTHMCLWLILSSLSLFNVNENRPTANNTTKERRWETLK